MEEAVAPFFNDDGLLLKDEWLTGLDEDRCFLVCSQANGSCK